MKETELEDVEINLFLDAIYQRYGYDFRNYARASVRRRARKILHDSGRAHLSQLIPDLLRDEAFARQTIYEFSVTVTDMFRDPNFYRAVRCSIAPYLRTYPFVRAWVAGCATGEEVYSLAILLQEENLYARATIFATDFNDQALKKAEEGIYLLKDVQQYTVNYQQAGGQSSFADYYHAEYGSAIINQSIKSHITFANHNLVTDGVFSEVQLIFFRNVLIYFNRQLQNRVLHMLAGSLSRGGFLCLGSKETLDFSGVRNQFKVVDEGEKIYQKVGV